MKKVFVSVLSFLNNPLTHIFVGCLGFVSLFLFLFLFVTNFDVDSFIIGFGLCVFLENFFDGIDLLIRRKRNSPPSGEDK